MILRSCYSQVTENEVTDITPERYPLVLRSVSEIHLTTEMPDLKVIFDKPQVITDKLNNFLEGMELIKKKDKTIAIDIDIQTSTQSSISVLNNNMVEVSDINNPLRLSEDLVYDKEITQNLTPQKTSLIENTDKNKESVNHKQFLERLLNPAILFNDFQRVENNDDFTEDLLMLKNQKDHALDTSNEIKSLGLDVTTTANLKDSVDFKINFRNSVQDPKQRTLFDLIEDMIQDNYSEESSSRDKIDEQVNVSSDSDLVICPPYQSYESSDMSSEHSIKSSSTSQAIPEFLEQIKNILNDDGTKNKDKPNVDDSGMLMATSSDVSVSGSDKHFALNSWIPVAIKNIQDSSEMTANIKQEEEEHKLIKNIASPFNFEFLQPKIQDSVESLTLNDKFQWFNAPPVFANNPQLGLKDILDKTQNPSLEDTIENTKTVNSFTPNKDKFHNECQIEIKMNSFRFKCPAIMLGEEWNLASPTRTADSSVNFKDFDYYMNDYNDDYDKDESEQSKDDLISNENSGKKVASLQYSAPEVIDGITTSIPSLKDAFDFIFKINSFNKTKIDKQDEINSSNQEKIKEEISSSSTTIPSFTSTSDNIDFNTEWSLLKEVFDTQQPKQLKVSEKQDFLNSQNAETFLESNSHVYDLEKKNNEMLNFMKQLNLFEDFDYTDICIIFPNFCPISSSSPWQHHVNLKKFLKHNHDDQTLHKKLQRNEWLT